MFLKAGARARIEKLRRQGRPISKVEDDFQKMPPAVVSHL
jgi:hypothetical protein